jgi:pilus assembly protein Flp/PilA
MKDYLMNLFIKAKNFMNDEKGQALVEYALILVLIAVVVILMLTGLGGNVNNTFSKVNSAMTP